MGNEFSNPADANASFVDNNSTASQSNYLSSVTLEPRTLNDYNVPKDHIRINTNVYRYAHAFVTGEKDERLVKNYTYVCRTFFIQRSDTVAADEYAHRETPPSSLFLPFIIDSPLPVSRAMISIDFGDKQPKFWRSCCKTAIASENRPHTWRGCMVLRKW